MLARALTCILAALVAVPLPALAQNPLPRGDTDCSATLTAADIATSVSGLGGEDGCDNSDCDRDGVVTSADVDCTLRCLFDRCPIPATAARVTSVAPEFGSGIAPFSTVRVVGTGFGPIDDPKFVTIGGQPAEVVGVIDADTLLVLVPPIDPGPAEIVVNAGAVDGFPFPLAVAESAPVGEPDSYDDVLALIDVAIDRFSELPLESIFGEDTALIRQQFERYLVELAAQRAELAADPAYTGEVQAMFDAAFDSSGVAEKLREAIAEIDAFGSGGEGGGAQGTADLERLRSLLGVVVIAASGGVTALIGLTGAPLAAVVAIAAALGSLAALLDAVLIAQNPPFIVGITYTDANGMPRSDPTAGGTARIQGTRFTAADTSLVIDTPRGTFNVVGEDRGSGNLAVTLPDALGFCGPVKFHLSRTRLGIKSNEINANVQPELLGLSADRVRLGQGVNAEVKGTSGCSANLHFREISRDSDNAVLSLRPVSVHSGECLIERVQLLFPERTYRVRAGVGMLRSKEEKTLEVASSLTGVSNVCAHTELQLPPGSPSMTGCTCSGIPEGVPLTGTRISFSAEGETLSVSRVGDRFADVVAILPGDGGSVTCKATFVTNRPLVSQPFAINVVDKTEPTVSLSAPPAEVDPGASVDFTATAEDNDFVTRIVLRAMGDAVTSAEQEKLCTLVESSCTKPFTVEIKRGAFSNREVTVQAEAFDGAGNKGTSTMRTFTVRPLTETTPPVVTIQSPQNGGRVRAGDMVQVAVRLTDEAENDSGIARVRIDVTGPAVASGVVPAELALPLPLKVATRAAPFTVRPASELGGITDRTIMITATGFDAAGNMASASVSVTAGGAPIITSVTPNPAVAGGNIRIAGDGFGETQGSSTVEIGTGFSELNVWSNNEILATVPEGFSGRADVAVVVDNVRSNLFPFSVLGSGDVRITLSWEDMNDLDLAVTDPTGATISYTNRFSDSGGQLDTDANSNCGSFTDPPRENIFYRTGAAPTGTYNVTVNYFAGCTEPKRPSPFKVEVVVDGTFRTLMEGTLAVDGSQSASFSR